MLTGRYVLIGVTLLASACSSRDPARLSDREAAEILQAAWKEEARSVIFGAIQFRRGSTQGVRDSRAITQQDIERYYDNNRELFSTPERIRASHILITTRGRTDADARKKAEELLIAIKAGSDFSSLAEQHSEDEASASRGGDIEFFSRGQMVPAFDQAAFALAPGQISDIVKSEYGFHIIKVTDRHEATTRPLRDVQAQIEDELRYSGSCYTTMARYSLYRAMAEGGLLALHDERDLSGSFTGWNDFFALTQTGVQRTATVGLTPQGAALGSVQRMGGCDWVRFVVGGHRIAQVVSNEPLDINGEKYRVVQGTHTFDIKPEFRDILAAAGEPAFSDRRFRALLKLDPFNARWTLRVADVGPREVDFQSQNVPTALAELRLIGGR